MYRSPTGKERLVIEFNPKDKKRFQKLAVDLGKTYAETGVFLMDIYERHPEFWPREQLTSHPEERPKGV